MNILVTISTILLILALSTQSILSKRIDVEKIQISHSGNMQAQRKAYNLCEKNLYKSKKGKYFLRKMLFNTICSNRSFMDNFNVRLPKW